MTIPAEFHPLLPYGSGPQYRCRSSTYHMSYVIPNHAGRRFTQGQLEQIFPMWRADVLDLPPKTPTIISRGMAAVHEIFKGGTEIDGKLISNDVYMSAFPMSEVGQSFLVTFLFRCFLVAVVEPGREVLTADVWKLAKMGEKVRDGNSNMDLEPHLQSKCIRNEYLPNCTILHVSMNRMNTYLFHP